MNFEYNILNNLRPWEEVTQNAAISQGPDEIRKNIEKLVDVEVENYLDSDEIVTALEQDYAKDKKLHSHIKTIMTCESLYKCFFDWFIENLNFADIADYEKERVAILGRATELANNKDFQKSAMKKIEKFENKNSDGIFSVFNLYAVNKAKVSVIQMIISCTLTKNENLLHIKGGGGGK